MTVKQGIVKVTVRMVKVCQGLTDSIRRNRQTEVRQRQVNTEESKDEARYGKFQEDQAEV